jgi:hypothetical protein
MLDFMIISALGASALLLVQRLDIECVNPPKRPAAKPLPKITLRHPAEILQ